MGSELRATDKYLESTETNSSLVLVFLKDLLTITKAQKILLDSSSIAALINISTSTLNQTKKAERFRPFQYIVNILQHIYCLVFSLTTFISLNKHVFSKKFSAVNT